MGTCKYEIAWKTAESSETKWWIICCSIKFLVKMKNASYLYIETKETNLAHPTLSSKMKGIVSEYSTNVESCKIWKKNS